MRNPMSYAARGLAILLLSAPLVPMAPSGAEDAPKAPCCFKNPRFAGTCEVQPGKDESCSQILDYLNNPMSKGRTYCNNTEVRGGWTSVACEAKK